MRFYYEHSHAELQLHSCRDVHGAEWNDTQDENVWEHYFCLWNETHPGIWSLKPWPRRELVLVSLPWSGRDLSNSGWADEARLVKRSF